MNPKAFLEFLSYAGKLKAIPRTGWIDSGIPDSESVADHSYRTALTAMVLSDSFGLDTCRVMQMALLHDLAESIIGDLTPSQKQVDHAEQEDQAMQRILSLLSEELRSSYWSIWREYQEQTTPEAVLVHDADKIEMMLQASEYQIENPDIDLSRFNQVKVSLGMKKIVEKIRV